MEEVDESCRKVVTPNIGRDQEDRQKWKRECPRKCAHKGPRQVNDTLPCGAGEGGDAGVLLCLVTHSRWRPPAPSGRQGRRNGDPGR